MDLVSYKGEMLEDYYSKIDNYQYEKGQKIYVNDSLDFKLNYLVNRYDTFDWIPKKLVRIIAS